MVSIAFAGPFVKKLLERLRAKQHRRGGTIEKKAGTNLQLSSGDGSRFMNRGCSPRAPGRGKARHSDARVVGSGIRLSRCVRGRTWCDESLDGWLFLDYPALDWHLFCARRLGLPSNNRSNSDLKPIVR